MNFFFLSDCDEEQKKLFNDKVYERRLFINKYEYVHTHTHTHHLTQKKYKTTARERSTSHLKEDPLAFPPIHSLSSDVWKRLS